ncbi:MAG: PhzF family phenazine biosynthesis protein [Burkholderiaceae bacterium]
MDCSRRFIQCDVFTDTPTKGNALAVVLDAEGLSDEAMASFAAWTNLAETTFVLPTDDPAADYHLRIFTPVREMPFAGHPTLGSCAAWLHVGGRPKQPGVVRQLCGVGIVEIFVDRDVPAFVAPPTAIRPMPEVDRKRIGKKLRLGEHAIVETAVLDNGPVWQVFELRSAEDVLAVDAMSVRWPDEKSIGLIGPHPGGSDCDYEVRMLAPSSGMSEDPITGSLNAALAHWFAMRKQLKDTMRVAQGRIINRHGRVFVSREGESVLIGGQTQILIDGAVTLPA